MRAAKCQADIRRRLISWFWTAVIMYRVLWPSFDKLTCFTLPGSFNCCEGHLFLILFSVINPLWRGVWRRVFVILVKTRTTFIDRTPSLGSMGQHSTRTILVSDTFVQNFTLNGIEWVAHADKVLAIRVEARSKWRPLLYTNTGTCGSFNNIVHSRESTAIEVRAAIHVDFGTCGLRYLGDVGHHGDRTWWFWWFWMTHPLLHSLAIFWLTSWNKQKHWFQVLLSRFVLYCGGTRETRIERGRQKTSAERLAGCWPHLPWSKPQGGIWLIRLLHI